MARKNQGWQEEWHMSRPKFCAHYVGTAENGLSVLEAYTGLIEKTKYFMAAHERQHYLAGAMMDMIIHAAIEEECIAGVRKNTLQETFASLIQHGLIHAETSVAPDTQAQTLMQKWRRDQVGNDPSNITSWLASSGQLLTVLPSEEALQSPNQSQLSPIQRDYVAKEKLYDFRHGEHPAALLCKENPILKKYFSLKVPAFKSMERTLEKLAYKNAHMPGTVSAFEPIHQVQDINRISVLANTPELEERFFSRLNLYRRYHSAQTVERPDFLPESRKLNISGVHDRKTLLAITSRNRFGEQIEAPEGRSFEGTVAEIASMSPQMFEAKELTHPIYEVQRLLEFKDLRKEMAGMNESKLLAYYLSARQEFLSPEKPYLETSPCLCARIQEEIPDAAMRHEQWASYPESARDGLLATMRRQLLAMHHIIQCAMLPQQTLLHIGEEYEHFRRAFLANETYATLYPAPYQNLARNATSMPAPIDSLLTEQGETLTSSLRDMFKQMQAMQRTMHVDAVRQSSKEWRMEWLREAIRSNQNMLRQNPSATPEDLAFSEDMLHAVAQGKSQQKEDMLDLDAIRANLNRKAKLR